MKKLLTLGLTILLSGCVTYYYPETALEDGVYYAEDDPAYVIDSSGYVDASYYPWASMDYFYLDYYPYRRYSYYGGFSFGVSYGYSPWYYGPHYYGHYSPWYSWHAPYYHYSHYYAWRPYRGHGYGHRNKHYKGNNKNRRNNNDYRYAGSGNNDRGTRRGEYADDVKKPDGNKGSRSYAGGENVAPTKRYVTTTPSGYSGDRGMEVRSRGSKSTGRTTTQPVRRGRPESIQLTPSTKGVANNDYRSKRSTGSAGEVRYRAGGKQGRTRIEPIGSGSGASTVAFANTASRSTSGGGNGGRYGHSAPVSDAGHGSSGTPSGPAASRGSSRPRQSSGSRSHSSSSGSKSSHSSASSSGSRKSSSNSSARHQSRK